MSSINVSMQYILGYMEIDYFNITWQPCCLCVTGLCNNNTVMGDGELCLSAL